MNIHNNPKVTVVTVCFNAATLIEDTIKSVISQTYKNIEYIIIDGGSTDGTVEIIKKYTPHIAFWKSEPDNGIYDAMNKGLSHATGLWINFMNAGDTFYCDETLSSIFKYQLEDKNIVYGDTLFVREDGNHVEKSFETDFLERNMPTCHQSFFVKTQYAKEIGFETRYKYAADYNMIYRIFQDKGKDKVVHLPVVISIYETRMGCSQQRPNEVYKETLMIRKRSVHKYYGFFRYYVKKIIGIK